MSLKVCYISAFSFPVKMIDRHGGSVDIGQSGANVGSSAASAVKGTSIAVQGADVGSGITTGGKPTGPGA